MSYMQVFMIWNFLIFIVITRLTAANWPHLLCSLQSLNFMTQRHPSTHLLDFYHQPKWISAGYAIILWDKLCGFMGPTCFSFFSWILQIVDAIISHGCFLRECTIQHSVVGERSRLDYGVELKVIITVSSIRFFSDDMIQW